MITWAQSRLLSGLSAKGKKAIWFKHLEWLFSQNDRSRLLKDGLRYNPQPSLMIIYRSHPKAGETKNGLYSKEEKNTK
ncbi:hypothetical protein RhiirB3_210217 [Rhizophagus irregularis]|nr:hypothetical protein RhiirB3_210217 [Rhizophagus irregularis]